LPSRAEEPRVEVAISFLQTNLAGYSRVMGIVKKRETQVRVGRDADK
jgi:hypothetical protein